VFAVGPSVRLLNRIGSSASRHLLRPKTPVSAMAPPFLDDMP
jgi:hypothetical protein